MSVDFAQQLIDILLLSDNFKMQSESLISKVAEYDSHSDDNRKCMAEAFDMLLRENIIWLDDEPIYEKRVDGIHFNNTLIGLTDTGRQASIN